MSKPLEDHLSPDAPEAHLPTPADMAALQRVRTRLFGETLTALERVERVEEHQALDNVIRLLSDMKVQPNRKPTRTRNATLMLLMAALENGDLYLRECELPVIGDDQGAPRLPQQALYSIQFDAGHFTLTALYARHQTAQTTLRSAGLDYITLANGQILKAPLWLRSYWPEPPADQFGALLQLTLDDLAAERGEAAWQVEAQGAHGDVYRWIGGSLTRYREAKR